MSLQEILNNECLQKLPLVLEEIKKSDFHARNSMIASTLRFAMNAAVSVDNMNEDQLLNFQKQVLSYFEYARSN